MRVPYPIVALVSCAPLVGSACAKQATAPQPVAAEPEPPTETEPLRPAPILLPASFEADRIFLDLRTADGQTLRLFTDTGGGLNIQRSAVERLDLPIAEVEGDDGRPLPVASLPELDEATTMPPVTILDGRLPIADEDPFGGIFGDGILGQAWFRGRIWTFDYSAHTMSLQPSSVECDHEPVPLGFLLDDAGTRRASYPRIVVEIDGTEHDLLFDTGATVRLTERAHAELDGEGPRERATSFIVRSVFDRWRQEHPDWRVIEAADRMAEDPMIEVPSVRIGPHTVGPVWFTARADPNFHEWMSQWMDRRVDGALGGSALEYFRVTVDYPAATACFERV
jgi:hypothetical protein